MVPFVLKKGHEIIGAIGGVVGIGVVVVGGGVVGVLRRVVAA